MVTLDFHLTWPMYKEIAHDNYIAFKVQETLTEIHEARKADQQSWAQDYAARVLQKMYRECKAHRELGKLLWKAKLSWLHQDRERCEMVARGVQSLWRAKQARRTFLGQIAACFDERQDPSTGQPYWVDVRTGESMWDKPPLLSFTENWGVKRKFYS